MIKPLTILNTFGAAVLSAMCVLNLAACKTELNSKGGLKEARTPAPRMNKEEIQSRFNGCVAEVQKSWRAEIDACEKASGRISNVTDPATEEIARRLNPSYRDDMVLRDNCFYHVREKAGFAESQCVAERNTALSTLDNQERADVLAERESDYQQRCEVFECETAYNQHRQQDSSQANQNTNEEEPEYENDWEEVE